MTAPTDRENWPTVAVLLAGGSGLRSALDYPKQFLRLGGLTVLEHTLLTFERAPFIDQIVVVGAEDWIDMTQAIVSNASVTKATAVIVGGASRNESTRAALRYLESDRYDQDFKVLIHDAVRPLVDESTLRRVSNGLNDFDAVDVVIPTADTIVEVKRDQLVRIPNRANLRRGQTPQGFTFSLLKAAYGKFDSSALRAFTDDCAVVLAAFSDLRVKVVDGSDFNIKITTPVDIHLADRLLQARQVALEDVRSSGQQDGVTVVIGGTSGIGRAIVDRLRAANRCVMSLSRQNGVDVRVESQVAAGLAACRDKYGSLAAVINSAGVLSAGKLTELDPEVLRNDIDVNLLGSINVARAALPHLRTTRGHLLLFTSSSYTRGRANYSVYCATKAGVVSLTQSLAEEWTNMGVRVNCINPARTKTPMRTRAFGKEPGDTLLTSTEVADAAIRVIDSSATGHVFDVRLNGPAR
jgi:2-C-methyl-D-erythritol 4-phosphate cytidylyltransferase